MPNAMNLAVRKLFSFPHAQILLAFFPKNVFARLHEAVGVLLRKEHWQVKARSGTPACRLEFASRPPKLSAAVSSAKSLAV